MITAQAWQISLLVLAGTAAIQPAAALELAPERIGAQLIYASETRLGGGLDARWRLHPQWHLRLSLEQSSYDTERTVSLIRYNENLDQTRLGLFVERQLLNTSEAGNLYASLGALYLSEGQALEAKPDLNTSYNLNGRIYTGTHLEGASGKVSYKRFAPYLGLGWQSSLLGKSAWSLTAEAGVVFNLQPRLTIHTDNPFNLPFLAEDLQAEADRHVRESKRNGDFFENVYPRIGISLNYSF